MANFLSSKFSLNKNWKPSPKVLALLILGIVIIAGAVVFGLWLGRKLVPPQQEISLPSSPEITEETFKPGETGEISDQELKEKGTLPLPQAIFNTTGVISEVGKDRLIVQGDGTNFSDKKPRELTLIFTASTIVFEPGQKTKYQGLEGLKHLKKGDSISISENIRGKTQFIVDYINKS
jgi:uncharacterized protein YneF (UPF0154 family)